MRFLFRSIIVGALLTISYLNVVTISHNQLGIAERIDIGLMEPVLEPGTHWFWTAFVPDRWKIHQMPKTLQFRINQKIPLRHSQVLLLEEMIQLNYQFSVEILPSSIVELIAWLEYKPQLFHPRTRDLASLIILDSFREIMIKTPDTRWRENFAMFLKKDFPEKLQRAFPSQNWFIVKNVILSSIQIPNLEIYRTQVSSLPKILATREKLIMKKLQNEAESHKIEILNRTELNKSEAYGNLLKKYDGLVEYLKTEKWRPVSIINRPFPIQDKPPNFKTKPKTNKKEEPVQLPPLNR